MKDVAKQVSVPRLNPLSEIHKGKKNIVKVCIP